MTAIWGSKRTECPLCGSSDGVSTNLQTGVRKCHACGKAMPPENSERSMGFSSVVNNIKRDRDTLASIAELPCDAIPSRGLTQEVAKMYGVRVDYDTGTREQLHAYFPFYKDGEIVAYKKRGLKEKTHTVIGNIKDVELFGSQRPSGGTKLLIITEGEFDAMAATQMLRSLGKNYKVVSLVNGANSKSIRDNLEWLESFDKVMLSFDTDEVGRKAAVEVANIMSVGKTYIMNHGEHKDANEILLKGRASDYFNIINSAKEHRPDGIVSIDEQWDTLQNYDTSRSVPYPWEGLNRLTYGLREREITLITAGSGVGKSAVIREIEHHLLTTTQDKIGILALEESTARTIYGIMSVAADQPLHLKEVRDTVPLEDRQAWFEILFKGNNAGRVYSYDHFGSTTEDTLLSRIRYMIKGLGCSWIILDHISIAVSGIETDDERKLIDRMMTKLRSIVEETGAGMIIVSHLRRLSGDRGHEDGAQVSLSHLRGSQSLAQLSDTVIALERNQSATDMEIINRTKVRVLKNRYAGNTGNACELQYSPITGRLTEVTYEF